ncbi:MAG: helix-hairpin-helix domain-containing protein [Solirubrobacterales bacterium]
MAGLSRLQLLVYAAVAVAVLLIGARWIRESDPEGADSRGVAYTAEAAGEDGEEEEEEGTFAVSADGEDVVVHVAGAVRDPGVYRLPEGSRVTDAVERAGGTGPGAAADSVNLAARLADGQQIVIPQAGPGGAASASAPADGPISLGTATLEQLDTIDGIGPVTAQSILDYRDEQGGLGSVDELDQVSGIGPATMEALRGRLQP